MSAKQGRLLCKITICGGSDEPLGNASQDLRLREKISACRTAQTGTGFVREIYQKMKPERLFL